MGHNGGSSIVKTCLVINFYRRIHSLFCHEPRCINVRVVTTEYINWNRVNNLSITDFLNIYYSTKKILLPRMHQWNATEWWILRLISVCFYVCGVFLPLFCLSESFKLTLKFQILLACSSLLSVDLRSKLMAAFSPLCNCLFCRLWTSVLCCKQECILEPAASLFLCLKETLFAFQI